jgi:hypothetical protein
MNGDRSERPRRGAAALATLILGLALSGCSGSAPTAAPSAVPTTAATTAPSTSTPVPSVATATAAPSPTGSPRPASGTVTLAGDPGLAGDLAITGIRCQLPAVAGMTIAVFATAPNGVFVQAILSAGSLAIRVYTGSGATASERNFSSSSLTSFDAATGAKFDTPVTPVAGPNPAGTIGAVTSAKGSIDCGGQRPGTSSLVFSGTGADGAFGPALNPVRVQCDTGPSVQATGIVQVGGKPVLALLAVRTGTFTVFTSNGTQTHFYTAPASGVTALTATSAKVDGDAVEAATAGGTAHTIHVAGELVCGVSGQF